MQSVVVMFRPKDSAAFQRLLPPPMQAPIMSGQPLPLNPVVTVQWVKDRLGAVFRSGGYAGLGGAGNDTG